MNELKKSPVFRFLSSYGLSVVLLLLLLLLTWLGTLEQTEHGIYKIQKKYFESFYLVFHAGPLPIPLPGAYLVMVVLFINLLLGGLFRVKWTWRGSGLLLTHAGIMFLLVSSFISFMSAVHGGVTLREGQSAAEFRSYHEWEIAAYPASERPDGSPAREYLVPHREFVGLDSDESRLFRGENVPFEFTITRVIPNARPVPAGRGPAGNGVADGVFLSERPSEKNSEQNILGADILLKVDGEAAAKPAILLGDGRRLPLLVSTPKGRWAIELRKKRMNLPFGLRLDKFTHEYYPGTMKPRVYMSDVTKLTEDAERKVKIEMNQPLRSDGFTVYQSSWNEDETGLYSGFSVVTNPSDQWPLYACIVIGIGLLVHFGRMLFHYLARETGARS